ncbi:hypothetical protein PM035_14220 [Halorubrum ezzemoulense]|uniref:hypothetical protein n=1 Tax=Halorubrum ezzemoulense TaxID=337243 RepID=UPI00232FE367|nr:hypothetical protein [Halorubrum ezzemoulense]MDB2262133.1 hypothetical protein [Halorubrum ezzemoulense]MDB2268840.1 hypothetical protein [Halorubrum ezzemoulense]
MTASSGLSRVRTLGRVATGFSIAGFIIVLAGFVVPSLQMIVLVLAGLAGLELVYQFGRSLVNGDRVRFGSLGTVCGVGVAAALVGAFAPLDILPAFESSRIGTGIFVTGFLLYIAIWEYGRRDLFRLTGRVTDK